MVNRFFEQFGAWKPFTKGLPPPLVDPRDDATMHLKFNPAWRPYVTGALSSLARPESYEDILDNFIREDIDFGSQLPWLIEDIPVVQFYNWRWIQKPGDNGDSSCSYVQIFTAPGVDGSWASQAYVSLPCENCEDMHQISLVGQQGESPFSYPVGGHVTSVFGFLVCTVVGNNFHITTVDCLDNEVAQDIPDQQFELTDLSIKEIQVQALGAFVLSINFNEDWSCGPA